MHCVSVPVSQPAREATVKLCWREQRRRRPDPQPAGKKCATFAAAAARSAQSTGHRQQLFHAARCRPNARAARAPPCRRRQRRRTAACLSGCTGAPLPYLLSSALRLPRPPIVTVVFSQIPVLYVTSSRALLAGFLGSSHSRPNSLECTARHTGRQAGSRRAAKSNSAHEFASLPGLKLTRPPPPQLHRHSVREHLELLLQHWPSILELVDFNRRLTRAILSAQPTAAFNLVPRFKHNVCH